MTACSSFEPPAHINKRRLGDVIKMGYKDTIYISGQQFMVSYAGEKDTRCALRTTCEESGMASVDLNIIHAGGEDKLPLIVKGLCFETDGSCSEPKTWNGYTFHVMQLSPYPGSNGAQASGTRRELELKVKKL